LSSFFFLGSTIVLLFIRHPSRGMIIGFLLSLRGDVL
jgi:hypothetical protein